MKELSAYTTQELNAVAAALITSLTYPPAIAPATRPQAVLLGGQSGAGKTALHDVFKGRFANNVIVINGDEYRSFHPRFRQLKKLYGDDYVLHTAAWAGAMTEALIDRLSRFGYNLIVEGTLRTAEVPLKTAHLLKERGYQVSLALMAVKPEISLLSCQLRYEEMRIAGTTPRATDPAHHRKIVDQIVSNLRTLEDSGVFEDVYLYTRSQVCLFPRETHQATASEVLAETLFGPWTTEERSHYQFLKDKLKRLRTIPESKTS